MKNLYWKQIGLGLAFDLILATVIAQAFDDKIFVFFVVFLGVQFGPFVFWLWNVCRYWVLYHLYFKSLLKRAMIADLAKFKLPARQDIIFMDEYISTVVEGEDYNHEMKGLLYATSGKVQAYKELAPFTIGLGYEACFEAAIAEYRGVSNQPTLDD